MSEFVIPRFHATLTSMVVGFCGLIHIAPTTGQSLSVPIANSTAATNPTSEAHSSENMVASVHPLATEAGVRALEQGGNAVDAAIATALMLGVVDGSNSGIGGGCFILVRTADGKMIAIDGREMAPSAAHRDMYLHDGIADPQLSQTGALAIGIPGALAAYYEAVSEFGNLKFSDVVLPAAQVAAAGFSVSREYAARLESEKLTLGRFPGSAEVLLKPNGTPFGPGESLVQTDLANTYRQIAEHGPSWFYNGPFALGVEQWSSANGGILTARDFANYRTVRRQPIQTRYRGYDVFGFPPPSSGGVHVAQILNILENFDLKELNTSAPATMKHVVAEAMKLAFADRAFWLGDPDHINVPQGLIDPGYAKDLADRIDLTRATVVKSHGVPPNAEADFFEKHTTHIAAADRAGNWVAITTTVNTTFGSKVIIPGLGVIMNNQMDDFSIAPGVPNAFGLVGGENNSVAPGKRPLSSMSPTIVLKEGQPVMTVGAAGGPTIITQVVWALINRLDLEMTLDQAIAAPRLHHQWSPDRLVVESAAADKIKSSLDQFGHKVEQSPGIGISQAISYEPTSGMFTGVADPRTSGSARGTIRSLAK